MFSWSELVSAASEELLRYYAFIQSYLRILMPFKCKDDHKSRNDLVFLIFNLIDNENHQTAPCIDLKEKEKLKSCLVKIIVSMLVLCCTLEYEIYIILMTVASLLILN